MSDRVASKSFLLLWVACLSTSFAVALWIGGARGSRGVLAVAADLPDSIAPELEDRLARLEARVRRLNDDVALRTPTVAESRRSVEARELANDTRGARTLADIAQRLARLEAYEKDREELNTQRVAHNLRRARAQQLADIEQREVVEAVIFNPSRTDSEKTAAWQRLMWLEGEPPSDEIVLTMVNIGATSEDDRAREVVWIGAESKHRSVLLVDPLIHALTDPAADVREEAADALSQYLQMGGVREALLAASQNDASEKVREEARKALVGEE